MPSRYSKPLKNRELEWYCQARHSGPAREAEAHYTPEAAHEPTREIRRLTWFLL